MSTQPPSRRAYGALDPVVQAQIGRMLRDVFAEDAEERLPQRFIELLAALEAKEKGR